MTKPLSSYIETLQAEGTLVSEGGFTLNTRAAFHKQERHNLPGPLDWLSSFSQCAVAIGAEEIRLAQEGGEVTWEFVMPPIDLKMLIDGFNERELPKERWLAHLIRGLWSVGVTQDYSFIVRVPDGVFVWDGDNGHVFNDRNDTGLISITIPSRRIKDGPGLRLFRRLVNAFNSMNLNSFVPPFGWTSPIPFYYQGERVDGLQQNVLYGERNVVRVNHSSLPGAIPLRLSSNTKFKGHPPLPPVVDLLWIVTTTKRDITSHPAKICWLRDGFGNETENIQGLDLPKGYELSVYLASDHFPTDLSSTKLIQTDALLRLKAEARRIVTDDLSRYLGL